MQVSRSRTDGDTPLRHRITQQKTGVQIGRRGSIRLYVTEPDKPKGVQFYADKPKPD